MGRKRKNSEELARPRQVVAPVVPINNRPRRSTKDAFYNNLSMLTATRKPPLEEEMLFEEKVKPKPKKEPQAVVDRRKSSSSASAEPTSPPPPPTAVEVKPSRRPVLVRQQKPEILNVPIPSSSSTPRASRIAAAAQNASLPQPSKPKEIVNGLHHYLPELRRPHFTLHSLDIESLSIDPRMQYSCNLCSRRLPTLSELNEHLSTHVETVTSCALCEKPSQDFTMEEYTQHLASHFLIEKNQTTCIFCGEISGLKSAPELAQHLLYYCPSIRYCFLCDSEIDVNQAHQHRKKRHSKLLNRYVCSTCFLGFPSLQPFLSHICDMRYRCLCEMTDVFLDHHIVNEHIDECDKAELQYHGLLIPETSGRKRCFFVNPHSVMPPNQNVPSTYGFRCPSPRLKSSDEHIVAVRGSSTSFPVPGTSSRARISNPRSQIQPLSTSDHRIRKFIKEMKFHQPPPQISTLPPVSFDNNVSIPFEPMSMGKPIYRPLKQQPVPKLTCSLPRVIYPRSNRMVARLLTPATTSNATTFFPPGFGGGGSNEAVENVYDFDGDGLIPLTKRVSEEENETIPSKRHCSNDDGEEPEIITL